MTTVLIVAFVVVMDFILIAVLLRALTESWNDLGKEFPAQTPAPDAVRRSFQSFKFGLFNLGWCVHVAADETHLHLVPVRFWRALSAMGASVPWEKVHLLKRGRRWSTVRIGTHTLKGPAWALNLAATNGEPSAVPAGRK